MHDPWEKGKPHFKIFCLLFLLLFLSVHTPSPYACQQTATHEVSGRSDRGVACWLA